MERLLLLLRKDDDGAIRGQGKPVLLRRKGTTRASARRGPGQDEDRPFRRQ
jgi:hypothetical protein